MPKWSHAETLPENKKPSCFSRFHWRPKDTSENARKSMQIHEIWRINANPEVHNPESFRKASGKLPESFQQLLAVGLAGPLAPRLVLNRCAFMAHPHPFSQSCNPESFRKGSRLSGSKIWGGVPWPFFMAQPSNAETLPEK